MKPNCFTRLLLLLSGWRKIKKVDSTQLTDSWITRREAADEAGHVVIGHLVGMKITDVRRDEHGTWRTYFDSDQTQVATQALTVEDQVKFLLGGVAGMEVANCITNADEYQEDLFQAIEVLTVRAPHTVSESVARKIIFRWRRECVTLLSEPINQSAFHSCMNHLLRYNGLSGKNVQEMIRVFFNENQQTES